MAKIVKKSDLTRSLGLKEQIELEPELDTARADSSRSGSGRVIRRDDRSALTEANKIILEAKTDAQKIRQEAKLLLDKVNEELEKARVIGFAEGKESGLADVTDLLTKARLAKEKMFSDIERPMIHLVYDIAEKVLGKELKENETAIVDLIRQALHAAMGQTILVIVNPVDLQNVREHQATLLSAIDASKSIQVRSDEKVKQGGCLIETEVGTIDAQLATQLAAIKHALGIVDLECVNKEVQPDEV